MKKIFVTMMAVIMVLSFASCSSVQKYEITIKSDDQYELTSAPDSVEDVSLKDNVLSISIKEEGEYKFVIQKVNDDSKQYTITLKYEDGKGEVSSDSDLELESAAVK